ncbi:MULTISPECIES: L-lactate dehydrogenase [Paenibacillus]|uniref:L-lactate dehydrogenase n=1 Tax=Paenibacillus lautus TaxID=1401 RepID=A0A1R1AZL7_PAELA|nr:L-lactate dehydrogenase [Paenibacillus lautus]OME91389.1 L-lactate dehydrogenase [Paenibacillus lautus]
MKNKISRVVLVGTGAVGCSYAYALINQGVVEELTLIDINEKRAEGEAMDLQHGMAFASTTTRVTSGTYAACEKADLVVITAGAPQKDKNETRLELVGKNAEIIRSITRDIMASGFNGIILVASNPVDIMTYVAWKESGLSKERVIGSGTTLDSARFRFMLGEYLGVDPRNVHAAIIGEHGDSEVPVWSQAAIGIEGLEKVLARRNNSGDKAALLSIFENTRDAAYHIIDRKGATYYGIGMCLVRITKAIFADENSILPVSCLMEGQYGQSDLYLSTPAVVNRTGIKEVIEIDLNETERQMLEKSAAVMRETIHGLNK